MDKEYILKRKLQICNNLNGNLEDFEDAVLKDDRELQKLYLEKRRVYALELTSLNVSLSFIASEMHTKKMLFNEIAADVSEE